MAEANDTGGSKAPPKISVIVPMYNCGPYIEECLGSLLRQSLTDFEAICVDDASQDDILTKAKNLAGKDPRFVFIELPENRGLSAARNAALNQACGEYIVFLDADDYLSDDALEKLYRRATAQELDELYYTGRSFYDSKDSFELVWEDLGRRTAVEEVFSGKDLFVVFESRDEYFPHATLRMVKRSLIEEQGIRFYEGIIHEDVLFNFLVLVSSKSSSLLSDLVYFRRVRPNSIMTQRSQSIATVLGHYVSVRAMKAWMREHAAELENAFIEAMTRQIEVFAQIAGHDWCNSE
ncbi:MAG: glycosyltransferase, partial [Eggerthellaceae bacterium]|nr:glycosyltransferase [Eggerthellaceae bacterium]